MHAAATTEQTTRQKQRTDKSGHHQVPAHLANGSEIQTSRSECACTAQSNTRLEGEDCGDQQQHSDRRHPLEKISGEQPQNRYPTRGGMPP